MSRMSQYGWRWGTVFLLILSSWAFLWMISASQLSRHDMDHDKSYFVSILVSAHVHDAGYLTLLGMWALMSIAMMLPGYVPVIRTYEDLHSSGHAPLSGFIAINLGYLGVWTAYSLVMSIIHHVINTGDVPLIENARSSWVAAVLFIAAAGLYQLSSLKNQCLIRCRNPMTVFLARGVGDFFHTTVTGVQFGLWCIGCCWLLMGLGLIGSLMSLTWMGLAMIIITLEKLPATGNYLTEPLSACLLLVAATVAAVNLY